MNIGWRQVFIGLPKPQVLPIRGKITNFICHWPKFKNLPLGEFSSLATICSRGGKYALFWHKTYVVRPLLGAICINICNFSDWQNVEQIFLKRWTSKCCAAHTWRKVNFQTLDSSLSNRARRNKNTMKVCVMDPTPCVCVCVCVKYPFQCMSCRSTLKPLKWLK